MKLWLCQRQSGILVERGDDRILTAQIESHQPIIHVHVRLPLPYELVRISYIFLRERRRVLHGRVVIGIFEYLEIVSAERDHPAGNGERLPCDLGDYHGGETAIFELQ